jgi:oxaloacetate decarboxylase gamma subunit
METGVVDLLIEGVWLMVAGMTIVFSFLLILVGLLVQMSRAVARWGPAEPLPEASATDLPAGTAGGDPRVIAAITAAIHQYRRRHRP